MAGTTPFKNDKANEQSWVPILSKIVGGGVAVAAILLAAIGTTAWNAGTFAVIIAGAGLFLFGMFTKIGKGGRYIGNDVDTSQL